jgi:hypothetical protein
VASPSNDRRPCEIICRKPVTDWLGTLNETDRARIEGAMQQLRLDGSSFGSKLAKRIKSARHPEMMELRSVGGHLRVLFAFDDSPQRAILLVGGDKSGEWNGWYERNVPMADKEYDNYLRSRGKETAWAPTTRRARERSVDAGR